jgi:hypothetical protein
MKSLTMLMSTKARSEWAAQPEAVDRDHDVVCNADLVLGVDASFPGYCVSRLEGELAALRHRVARDDRKIENSRHERIGIDQNPRDVGSAQRIDLDVFAQRGPQQTGRIGKQCIDVDVARLRWLAACEGEQIRGQAGTAGGSLGDQPCYCCKVRPIHDGLRQDFDRSAMTVRMLLKSWTTPPVS